jgi:hypothetical protein
MNRILAAAALALALSVSLAHADSVFERAQEKFAEEAKTPDEFPKITAEVMAKLAAEHCLPGENEIVCQVVLLCSRAPEIAGEALPDDAEFETARKALDNAGGDLKEMGIASDRMRAASAHYQQAMAAVIARCETKVRAEYAHAVIADKAETAGKAKAEADRAQADAAAKAEADRARIEAEVKAKIEAERAQIEAEAKAKVRAQIEADLRAKAVAEADAKADIAAAQRAKDRAAADAEAAAEARMEAEAAARNADNLRAANAAREASIRADKKAAEVKASDEARIAAEAEARNADNDREARAADEATARHKAEEEARIAAEAKAAHEANVREANAKAEAAVRFETENLNKVRAEAERTGSYELATFCNLRVEHKRMLQRDLANHYDQHVVTDRELVKQSEIYCDVLRQRGKGYMIHGG